MKRNLLLTILAAVGFAACAQNPNSKNSSSKKAPDENTLLWRISGNGLSKPSYLFGTMHMICANDIEVSDSLRNAIQRSDKVYLEVDMDDMMGMMMKMMMDPDKLTMQGDTTLSDLLTPDEYKKVKTYFEQNSGGMLPFAMLEKFKPMLIQSLVMGQSGKCENMIIMEQLVMDVAKKNRKDIDGLETIDYQLGIFDKIPYKVQAQGLVKMADSKEDADKEMKVLTEAYRSQQLSKMENLTKEDPSIDQFANLLLYDRNTNWVTKLQGLMKDNALVIAVGAGHLPGDKGVINLLRKAGYKVEPVKNEMIKQKVKEI